MSDAAYTWYTKIMLILMCLSMFLIARAGTRYYMVATSEVLAEDYIETVRNGWIDIEEFTKFSYRVAEFGYATEICIQRYGSDSYYDVLNTDEIINSATDFHGRQYYWLKPNDFVYIKLTKKMSTIKESVVYHGEGGII